MPLVQATRSYGRTPKAPTVPTGFRSTTVKSKLPKPLSTGALQQGQPKVTPVVGKLPQNQKDNEAFQNLRNAVKGDTTPKSSGGGNVWPGIRCQTGCGGSCGTGGCDSDKSPRIQYGVKNRTPTVDFNVRITIPPDYTAKDTATLQIGGGQHTKGCGWDGYKLYIGINGKPNAMGIEYGKGADYPTFRRCKDIIQNLL